MFKNIRIHTLESRKKIHSRNIDKIKGECIRVKLQGTWVLSVLLY